jgi:anti-sigma-K factor RskA
MDTSWSGNLEEVYGAMSRQTDRTIDYRLQAGEYVLGTLQDDERHNFEHALAREFSLRAAVDEWENRLSFLLDEVDPVDPSSEVWRAIERQIKGSSGLSFQSLWDSLRFWRGLGMLTATILFLGLNLFRVTEHAPDADSMMVITNLSAQPGWVVTSYQDNDYLRASAIGSTTLPQGRYCLLWMEDREGKMVSIGILPHQGSEQFPLPATVKEKTLFKVSVETNQSGAPVLPSRDVIFEGRLRNI